MNERDGLKYKSDFQLQEEIAEINEIKMYAWHGISKPKLLMNPIKILEHINKSSFGDGPLLYLRLFNSRSNQTSYELHKGNNTWLFKEPREIAILGRYQAIQILQKLNDVISNRNFLTFEIIPEE